MRFDYFLTHMYGTNMGRRRAVRTAAKLGVGAGAGGALAAFGSSLLHEEIVAAAQASVRRLEHRSFSAAALQPEPINDEMFDVAAVEAGAWVPGPYGAGDQRGGFNEVTPQKTAAALRLLDLGRPVVTYNLGELMFNGFPAFRTMPPRLYDQRLTVGGHPVSDEFEGIMGSADPTGPNRISAHEERFPNSGTYQIATQTDNLNHVGLADMYYNGFRGSAISRTWGTVALGGENMGPIVTRGVVLDIVGLKVSQGATSDYFTAANGSPVLRDNYRVTVEDMQEAMRRAGIREILAGDVVLLHEGWTHLVRADPDRYLMQEPGLFLMEARFLAANRPAIIGSDAWGLEVLDPMVTKGNFFPVHQLLFMRYGIRIGEGYVTDALVEDGVFEFIFLLTPQYAMGSTAGNTPPAALGQPRPRP